jgi:hypothetical protein
MDRLKHHTAIKSQGYWLRDMARVLPERRNQSENCTSEGPSAERYAAAQCVSFSLPDQRPKNRQPTRKKAAK